jgi:hypothetical protein
MNLEDIAKTLPWGFHDAYFEAAEVDWSGCRRAPRPFCPAGC